MEDDQQFCLRWNNHQSTLIQNFDTLLESGTLVDCTLAAEGKYLKAHKVVLSACSPYFEGLLSEHYDKHPVFILKDVKFKELKAMMDYMYRGEVNISQDQLTALLKAAESLQIKGLSDSRTGGGAAGGSATSSSKTETRSAKAASSTAATSSSLDIPHASSGLTIEKNSKVPRQSLQQVSVSDLPEDSASPQLRGLSSREGSQSPTSRKRLRKRKRSVNNDDTNSMENHEASNSSDVNISAPALGVAPVATEEKSHADPAETIGRSALMQQLTKPADEMLQIPIEKPEPSEEMIQPKSEYLDDQDDVEDLTNLDDDMNDLNEMEQDNSRAGPSHDPSQHGGIASWHISGDRSNASVVGAAAGPPGQQDEVFLAAHEAAQAQRDSQEKKVTKSEKSPVKISQIRNSSEKFEKKVTEAEKSPMKISHIRNFSEELLETAKLVFDSSILETDLIICNELINLKEDDEDLTEQNVTVSFNEKNSDDSKEIVLSNAHDTDFDSIREENFSSKNEINSDDSNDKTSLNNRIDTDFDFVNQENASSKHEKNSDDLNEKTTSNNISDIDSKKESVVSNVLNNNEDAALVYEFQDDENPRPKKRKKRNFSTRNLYKFNCLTCEKTIQKVYGKQISICPDCGSQLYFSCKRCSKTYVSFNAIYRHLKFKCYKELNKLTIGQHYEESKNSSPKQNRPKIKTKSIKKFGKKKVTNIKDLYRFYCTDCEKNVPNTDNPELICHVCNNRLQYECINCGKLYRGFIGLYSHVWTICCKKLTIQNAEKTPKEGPVLVDENKTGEETKSGNLCPKCGEMYNRGISEQCEPGKLYQCHFCSFDCCHKSNLDCHVETQHKKKINPVVYSISDIKNSTIVDDFFSRGKQKIKSLMQMYCPNCHITPENESVDLKKSSCNVCSNFLSYQCKVCNRIYSQSSAMYNHLKHDCNKQRIYKCPECHYKAKRSLHLDLHIKRIHSEKVCSGCGKRFTIGSHLKKHQLKFNCGYEPNFKCNHCDYTSNVKVGLCAHITRKHKELF